MQENGIIGDSKIVDGSGAFALVNMAHISDLGAAGVTDSPFKSADIATSSRHKWLRG